VAKTTYYHYSLHTRYNNELRDDVLSQHIEMSRFIGFQRSRS